MEKKLSSVFFSNRLKNVESGDFAPVKDSRKLCSLELSFEIESLDCFLIFKSLPSENFQSENKGLLLKQNKKLVNFNFSGMGPKYL